MPEETKLLKKKVKKKTKKKKTKTKITRAYTTSGLVMISVPASLAYQIGLIIGREIVQVGR